jgi:hypothetical protein
LAKGKISQWMYDAGTAWRADIEAAQSFRGQEVGKDVVQGGLMAGTISDSQAMAMQRLGEVKDAIVLTVAGGIIGWSHDLTRTACTAMTAKVADGLTARELTRIQTTLEPIAWVYRIAPSGSIANRLSGVGGRRACRGDVK